MIVSILQFAKLYTRNCYLNFVQWSFGVTCWEIFSTAKTPYPGIHPTSLIAQLENGERLPKPYNAACCDSMYVIILDVCTKDTNIYKSMIVVVIYRTSTWQD